MNVRVFGAIALFTSLTPFARSEDPTDIKNFVKPLKQISAAGSGVMYGVTDKSEIYRWTGSGWELIEGQLTQLSVGLKNSKPELWGVNAVNNSIWRATATGWVQQPGAARYVAVSKDGEVVVAVGLNGKPYLWKGTDWGELPTAPVLKQVAIGKSDQIYGLTEAGALYRWRPNLNNWVLVKSRTLRSISVGLDGSLGSVDPGNHAMVRKSDNVDAELNGSTAIPEYYTVVTPIVDNLEIVDRNVQIALDRNGMVAQLGTPWTPSLLTLSGSPLTISTNTNTNTSTSFFQPEIKFVSGPPPPLFMNGCIVLNSQLKLALPEIASSLNPAVLGQPVTVTVKVYMADGTEVKFLDGATLIGTSQLKSRVAAVTVAGLTVGAHEISANWVDNGTAKSVKLTQHVGTTAPVATNQSATVRIPYGCTNMAFQSSVNAIAQVQVGPQMAQRLTNMFADLNREGSSTTTATTTTAPLSSWVAQAAQAAAPGSQPIVCAARDFLNMSAHSWVRFEMPAGYEGQSIRIPAGSYNNYVFPACNRVWWDELLFACTRSSGWALTGGRYDANGLCDSRPGSSPYVKTGNR